MMIHLIRFNHSYYEFKKQLDSKEDEIVKSIRVIKNEVIDIADMVENLSRAIIALNEKIDVNNQTVSAKVDTIIETHGFD
jgi:archaellum component FlaC